MTEAWLLFPLVLSWARIWEAKATSVEGHWNPGRLLYRPCNTFTDHSHANTLDTCKNLSNRRLLRRGRSRCSMSDVKGEKDINQPQFIHRGGASPWLTCGEFDHSWRGDIDCSRAYENRVVSWQTGRLPNSLPPPPRWSETSETGILRTWVFQVATCKSPSGL